MYDHIWSTGGGERGEWGGGIGTAFPIGKAFPFGTKKISPQACTWVLVANQRQVSRGEACPRALPSAPVGDCVC